MKITKEQRADLEEKATAAQPAWNGHVSDYASRDYLSAAKPTTILALLDDLKEVETICEDTRALEELRLRAEKAEDERDKLKTEKQRRETLCGDSGCMVCHRPFRFEEEAITGLCCVCVSNAQGYDKLKADLAKAVEAYDQATGLLKAQLAEARAELAAVKEKSRLYPMQEGAAVPWYVMAPHDAQAKKNHRQTLQRLAERGGLSSCEAWAIVNDVEFEEVERRGFDAVRRLWQEYAEKVNGREAELATCREVLLACRDQAQIPAIAALIDSAIVKKGTDK